MKMQKRENYNRHLKLILKKAIEEQTWVFILNADHRIRFLYNMRTEGLNLVAVRSIKNITAGIQVTKINVLASG